MPVVTFYTHIAVIRPYVIRIRAAFHQHVQAWMRSFSSMAARRIFPLLTRKELSVPLFSSFPERVPASLLKSVFDTARTIPFETQPDPTAIEEMKTKFKGWTYSLPTGCVVKGGEVKVGYKDHPEVNWTITCATDCAVTGQ